MVINFITSFCLGIVLYNFTNSIITAVPATLILFMIICRLRAVKTSFLKLGLYALCILVGIAYNFLYQTHLEKTYYNYENYETECSLIVKSEPYYSGAYISFRARVCFDNIKADAYVNIEGENQKFITLGNTVTLEKARISSIKDTTNGTNFNLKKYSQSQKIYLQVKSDTENLVVTGKQKNLLNIFSDMRIAVNKRLKYFFSGNILALVSGMVTGDTTSAKENFDAVMSGMGITHIVVVSGAHFAIVILLISRFLQLFMADRKFIAPAILIISFLLAAFFGFSASVIRAAALACIYGVCDIFSKERHTAQSAAFLTLFGLFLYNPFMVNDIALQLSFGAVLGIGLFCDKIKARLKFVPSFIAESVSASLSANVFTIPVIASCFGKISLMFIVGNIIITPFVPFIMYSGILLCILSIPWMYGAVMLSNPVKYFCEGIFGILELIFQNVKSEIKIFHFSNFDLYVYFLIVMLWTSKKKLICRTTAGMLVIILAVTSVVNIPAYYAKSYEFIKPDFYDNARTLIVTPKGESIFVDMSNTVPGKKQIDNKIVNLINAKTKGKIDHYIVMAEKQLDLLNKLENKLEISRVYCAEQIENKLPDYVKNITFVKNKSVIKIDDFMLTIAPDKDYNITRVDCSVYGKDIGILRNFNDISKDYNYIFPTTYSHSKIKDEKILDKTIIKNNYKQIATLVIQPEKVMIN